MIELKRLSSESVPAALDKAKWYRLLNEPHEAESICLDILEVAPDHQDALITLLLALTDSFHNELNRSFPLAQEVAERISDQYCKAYYSGIIYERRAKSHLKHGAPGSGPIAYDWFMKALESFDRAIKVCGAHNQDALLRWNSCARIINAKPEVKPGEPDNSEMFLDSFDTPH
jgi:hypothetical protein